MIEKATKTQADIRRMDILELLEKESRALRLSRKEDSEISPDFQGSFTNRLIFRTELLNELLGG